jgi:hypothetical protein
MIRLIAPVAAPSRVTERSGRRVRSQPNTRALHGADGSLEARWWEGASRSSAGKHPQSSGVDAPTVASSGRRHAPGEGEKAVSIIDGALKANATIAEDYDPSRGKPPEPQIAIVTCADPRVNQHRADAGSR